MKTQWENLVIKGSNFADFVRLRPHTYKCTQQSLKGGNKNEREICIEKLVSFVFPVFSSKNNVANYVFYACPYFLFRVIT